MIGFGTPPDTSSYPASNVRLPTTPTSPAARHRRDVIFFGNFPTTARDEGVDEGDDDEDRGEGEQPHRTPTLPLSAGSRGSAPHAADALAGEVARLARGAERGEARLREAAAEE